MLRVEFGARGAWRGFCRVRAAASVRNDSPFVKLHILQSGSQEGLGPGSAHVLVGDEVK